MHSYTESILRIHELTPYSTQQLLADIGDYDYWLSLFSLARCLQLIDVVFADTSKMHVAVAFLNDIEICACDVTSPAVFICEKCLPKHEHWHVPPETSF